MTNIAIEHGPVEIVDFPINSMVIFHSYVNIYQRVIYIVKQYLGLQKQVETWRCEYVTVLAVHL